MSVVGYVPEMQDERIGGEAECDPQDHQQRDDVQGDIWNAAGTEARFLKCEAATHADDEQGDDEDKEKAEERLPDSEGQSDQSDKRP